MVGSTGVDMYVEGAKLSVGVKKLLQLGGLVEVKGRRVDITQDGFAFILQEVNAQVWTMLILYLENAETVGSISLLLFPFSLSPESLRSFIVHSLEVRQPNAHSLHAAEHGSRRRPLLPLHAW